MGQTLEVKILSQEVLTYPVNRRYLFPHKLIRASCHQVLSTVGKGLQAVSGCQQFLPCTSHLSGIENRLAARTKQLELV